MLLWEHNAKSSLTNPASFQDSLCPFSRGKHRLAKERYRNYTCQLELLLIFIPDVKRLLVCHVVSPYIGTSKTDVILLLSI